MLEPFQCLKQYKIIFGVKCPWCIQYSDAKCSGWVRMYFPHPLDFKVVLFTIKGQKIATQNLYSNARSVVTANPPSMSVVTTESSC